MTSFNPTGEILGVAGGKGAQVHLVDWKSGAGQVIGSLKCAGGGSVSGLWWFGGSSSSAQSLGETSSRDHLAILTSDAEVYLWDVAERRCVKRWKDEGGYRGAGRTLAGTQSGNGYMAVGYVISVTLPTRVYLDSKFRSSSGLVNFYNSTSYSLQESTKDPKPIKSIGNLTTAISTLKFNHDAQLLAIASQEKKDSMRLVTFCSSPTCYASHVETP